MKLNFARGLVRARLLCLLFLAAVQSVCHAEAQCSDDYQYQLAAQLEEGGYWMSFKGAAPLPIRHIGGDKTMVLEVTRLNDQWLQVEVALSTGHGLSAWHVQVEMLRNSPLAFTKTFRPAPDMPMFGLQLIPVCKGT